MSKEIYRHRLEATATAKIDVSAVAYGDSQKHHKIKLDNVALRLNDDNRSHYEAVSANITIDANQLPALIKALQEAQEAIVIVTELQKSLDKPQASQS